MSLLSLQAGDTEPIRYRKHWHTEIPSIQGPWTAFTHKNASQIVEEYPNERLGRLLYQPQTATKKLLKIAKDNKSSQE
jgi:large subunit ribosomal protein L43